MVSASFDSASIPPEMLIFFRDIKEHPDDDTPRLIFADWLQEHGDAATAARGEFLRLQVLRHRLSPDDPSYGLLKRREGELLKDYCWSWLGTLPDLVKRWSFERGLVQIEARSEKILTAEMEMIARSKLGFWLDSLTVRGLALPHMSRLATSSLLRHLNALDLSRSHLRGGLQRLLRSSSLRHLSHLVLSHNRLESQEIAFLALCPHLVQLCTLELEHCRLDEAATFHLAASPHLARLTSLCIGNNPIGQNGITVLRRVFGNRVHF